ncbi:MAG: hypothetical protein ACI9JM_001953 [Halioglobus sp.]|jgi:hypothetical protein
MSSVNDEVLDLQALTGRRVGPYLSFNPVSRVQIWQWCSAMGDDNPLYLNDKYRSTAGFDRVVAPPAMMQMWTMRDVNMLHPTGSTDDKAYAVFDVLTENGLPGNVAVSYDITFNRFLLEGDQAHHYSTITAISDLKKTALGEGYFVTERAEFLDQKEELFAEALITYFQYKPASQDETVTEQAPALAPVISLEGNWHTDFSDLGFEEVHEGQSLPELVIPITHKLIVSGALATQDFIDVHHNVPAAQAAAVPNIFMNILTTSGLCARYLSDWAGPASRLKKISFKLMAPNMPGDTMVMQGNVSTMEKENSLVSVQFAGKNNSGFHVTGKATIALAS